MQLPFLKNKKNQGGGTPTVEMTREPDSTSARALAEGVAEELLQAIDKKDFKAIRTAIKAFIVAIQQQDEEQDARA